MSNKLTILLEFFTISISFSLGGLIINKLLIWSKVKSSITGFDGLDSPFITSVDSNA